MELVKDFQQDIIEDMEIITGVNLSKKSLPKTLAKEIELKKKNLLKENGSISVLGLVNKPSIKDIKKQENKQFEHLKLKKWVLEYRKKVGQKTGGIKLYTELKDQMTKQGINIGRDNFY